MAKAQTIIGRKNEMETLDRVYNSYKSEFLRACLKILFCQSGYAV